jgi:hypothetical protein
MKTEILSIMSRMDAVQKGLTCLMVIAAVLFLIGVIIIIIRSLKLPKLFISHRRYNRGFAKNFSKNTFITR